MDKEDMECEEIRSGGAEAASTSQQKPMDPGKPGYSAGDNTIPAGLEALFTVCRKLYPEQPNPLQVTALVKYWLGGPDPLDYISMYEVPGDEKRGILPHWHYISFGLSDIHGDGRVHEFTGPSHESGFGFELTMRLKKEPGDKAPPTWPAAVMQGLAKYVFKSDTVLLEHDHVSLNASLDGSDSCIQHMLMAEDPTLGKVDTPNGSVQFIQVVGITSEELRAVQHWNGGGVLSIMRRKVLSGGPWLITDMKRQKCIYELDPAVAEEIETGIEENGSDLSGVSAKICWASCDPQQSALNSNSSTSPIIDGIELPVDQLSISATSNSLSLEKPKASSEAGPAVDAVPVNAITSLHININLESGALLPLALRGRLKHSRHFTFRSVTSPCAVTLVPEGVVGSFVSPGAPYAVRGPWLQVLIPPDLLDKMSHDLSALADPDQVKVPVTYQWPSHKLIITVLKEE